MGLTTSSTGHAGAWRMALIASLATNIGAGLMFGSFGVLLVPIEQQLHVDRSVSVLGIPLVLIGNALLSPFAGSLIDRFGIRALMIFGAVISAVGYFILSLATRIEVNLIAYAFFVGPGVVLLSTVVPAALVTRWFAEKRGRALGLVNTHVMIILMPLVAVPLLAIGGPSLVYRAMALIALLLVPVLWFIRERPIAVDGGAADRGLGDRGPADRGPVDGASRRPEAVPLLRSLPYWALCIPAAALGMGSTVLATHVVPMALGWGVDPTVAPILVSVMSGGGIAGSYIYGWLADRIGGGRALSVNCTLQIVLWGVLLTQPPVAQMIVVIGLIGIGGSGMVAPFCAALSEHFGTANFARAFGVSHLITLPLIAVGTPLAGYIFVRSGSYSGALILQIGFYALGAVLAFLASTTRKIEPGRRAQYAGH